MDAAALEEFVPELSLARGIEQGPYHHLDVLDHILQTVRGIDNELEEGRINAEIHPDRLPDLRVAALLHDIAKPVTRGAYEGRIIFVAHDTLGARMAHTSCKRLGLSAAVTDLAATLTALHLKIGFMQSSRTDHPPKRLAEAAGPFGEELAVLCLSDRLAAQGPKLKPEHIQRHEELCVEFLHIYRKFGTQPPPDYETLTHRLNLQTPADAGYAASRLRALGTPGLNPEEALESL